MSENPEPARVPQVLSRMLAMWNDRDSSTARSYIEDVFSEEVVFIDPTHDIVGHDAFEEMVKAFRLSLPDADLSLSSGVDAHHGLHRYHWEIRRGQELLITGFDVAQISADGKIDRVEGFFGPIPEG